MKTLKVEFTANYSPRKKGEKVELEKRLAEYYISLGVAKEQCEGCDDGKPCTDCEKAKEDPGGVNMDSGNSFSNEEENQPATTSQRKSNNKKN